MKKLILLAAVLAMVLLASAPVIAQEVGFDDQELESGGIETETSLSIEGDNNNACLGQSQTGQSGNFTNQQGSVQFFSGADDVEFEGGEITFVPENATVCEQGVEQAAAASSWGW